MARKQRRKDRGRGQPDERGASSHKHVSFNNPFKGLRQKLATVAEPVVATPEPVSTRPEPPAPIDDADLLAQAMEGVAPLRDRPTPRLPDPSPVPAPERLNEDQEAMLELSELVAGQRPFDITNTDEHVEGAVHGLDPRILKRLKKGEFALAGHVDLHGMTRDEAHAELDRFVTASRRESKRCVLVVHGRGLHSKDQRPVLKEAVVAWLGRSALRKQVLAFCSSRPYDGGAGALYVLLRR